MWNPEHAKQTFPNICYNGTLLNVLPFYISLNSNFPPDISDNMGVRFSRSCRELTAVVSLNCQRHASAMLTDRAAKYGGNRVRAVRRSLTYVMSTERSIRVLRTQKHTNVGRFIFTFHYTRSAGPPHRASKRPRSLRGEEFSRRQPNTELTADCTQCRTSGSGKHRNEIIFHYIYNPSPPVPYY